MYIVSFMTNTNRIQAIGFTVKLFLFFQKFQGSVAFEILSQKMHYEEGQARGKCILKFSEPTSYLRANSPTRLIQ